MHNSALTLYDNIARDFNPINSNNINNKILLVLKNGISSICYK